METILLAIIALCLLVQVLFFVPMVIELRRALSRLSKSMDEGLKPAMEELQAAMKSLRVITEDLGGITSDAREFSKSIGEVGRTISAINVLVENVGSSVSVRTMSVKAGIRAAIEYLAKNLIRKGDGR